MKHIAWVIFLLPACFQNSYFLCEWMPCYILNSHVAFCQYGITSYVFKCVFCVNVLLHFKQAWRFSPVSICGFSNYPPGRMSWHILSRHEAFLMRQNMASLQCGSINVFLKCPIVWMICHILNSHVAFCQ